MKPGHPKVIAPCSVDADQLSADVCASVSEVLSRVGDKWSILVIHMLTGGSLRFSELKRKLPSISQKVLTSTLRSLERDGYLTRSVTPGIPPRVDYALTAMGGDVLTPVTALAAWAFRHRLQVEAARATFDMQQKAA